MARKKCIRIDFVEKKGGKLQCVVKVSGRKVFDGRLSDCEAFIQGYIGRPIDLNKSALLRWYF